VFSSEKQTDFRALEVGIPASRLVQFAPPSMVFRMIQKLPVAYPTMAEGKYTAYKF
jgi:hypothetical protein